MKKILYSLFGLLFALTGLSLIHIFSISPKYDPDTTEERVTEFYINVGWAGSAAGYVEIPLLDGTALVGPGYRIVITQLTAP